MCLEVPAVYGKHPEGRAGQAMRLKWIFFG